MAYLDGTPGIDVLHNTSTILGDEDEVQPDASVTLPARLGGQTREENGFIVGSPELVVEVASSTVSFDLQKKASYERAGVRELLIVVVRDPQVLWFVREGDRFVPLAPGADGFFRSPHFGGLWLDPQALLQRNTKRLVEVLQLGLASPQHAQLLERMQPG